LKLLQVEEAKKINKKKSEEYESSKAVKTREVLLHLWSDDEA